MGTLLRDVRMPTDRDAALATESSRALASILNNPSDEIEIELSETKEKIKVPLLALHLLKDILEHMTKGEPVSIIPINAELTTQQAADALNVSRPFLIKLIDNGQIKCRMVGSHRRVRYDELMAYKAKTDSKRQEDLDELVKISQSEDMGY